MYTTKFFELTNYLTYKKLEFVSQYKVFKTSLNLRKTSKLTKTLQKA